VPESALRQGRIAVAALGFGQISEQRAVFPVLAHRVDDDLFRFIEFLELEQDYCKESRAAFGLRVNPVELTRWFKAIWDESVIQCAMDEIRELVRLVPTALEVDRQDLCAPLVPRDFAVAARLVAVSTPVVWLYPAFCRRVLRESSCGKRGVQFFDQREEAIAEQLMRFAESAALAKWRVIEIVRLDAHAGGDVVADEVEP